jgi:hypothetical protein
MAYYFSLYSKQKSFSKSEQTKAKRKIISMLNSLFKLKRLNEGIDLTSKLYVLSIY